MRAKIDEIIKILNDYKLDSPLGVNAKIEALEKLHALFTTQLDELAKRVEGMVKSYKTDENVNKNQLAGYNSALADVLAEIRKLKDEK